MDVLAEKLCTEVNLLAQRITAAGDRLSAEMREGFETLDRRVTRLEVRLLSGERG